MAIPIEDRMRPGRSGWRVVSIECGPDAAGGLMVEDLAKFRAAGDAWKYAKDLAELESMAWGWARYAIVLR